MNKRFGLFLEPEIMFFDYIIDLKSQLRKLNNDQYYINEIPHLTLMHGIYQDHKLLLDQFKNFKAFKPLYLKSAKPFIFYDDIKKGRNTLTYAFSKNNELIALQKVLLSKFQPDSPHQFFNLTNVEYLKNLENYNYPFVGEHLIPHVTITNNNLGKNSEEIELFLKAPKFKSVTFSKLYIARIENNVINKLHSFVI